MPSLGACLKLTYLIVAEQFLLIPVNLLTSDLKMTLGNLKYQMTAPDSCHLCFLKIAELVVQHVFLLI